MNKKITIYTKQGCIHCDRIKDWMNNNHIKFNEVDIFTVTDIELRRDINGVPYTIINIDKQKEVIIGFNKERLSSVLMY